MQKEDDMSFKKYNKIQGNIFEKEFKEKPFWT